MTDQSTTTTNDQPAIRQPIISSRPPPPPQTTSQPSAGISSETDTHFKLLEKMKACIALTVLFVLLFGTEVKPAAGGVTDAEKQGIVNKHNELRRGVQPTASNMLKMMWNEEAAANAQKWADKCNQEHSPRAERTISTSGCGENIYMSGGKMTWEEAIQGWHSEVKDWQYGKGSVNGGVVGHFTQVVWYRSNQIGCAVAHCPDAKYDYFYVCQYCSPGNVGGVAEPYKAGPTCGDCPNDCDDKLCTNPCPYTNKFSNCASLKESYGCGHTTIAGWCPASCKCTTKII